MLRIGIWNIAVVVVGRSNIGFRITIVSGSAGIKDCSAVIAQADEVIGTEVAMCGGGGRQVCDDDGIALQQFLQHATL